MPRIRTIKPEFFWDIKIGKLSPYARLTFIGLWCLADDYGTLNMHPLVIKGQLFPFDPDVDIEACLQELENQKLILRYGPEKIYIFIPNFTKHQKINRPSEQRQAPLPEELGIDLEAWLNEDSLSTHGGLSEPSVSPHGALSEDSVTETETETETEMEMETETENKLSTAKAVLVVAANAATTTSKSHAENSSSQEVTGEKKPSKGEKIPSCPYQEIVNLYHEILPELPQCRVLNETRKSYLRARWREILTKPELMAIMVPEHKELVMHSDRQKGLLWFERFFRYVAESDFLCGKVPPSKGRNKPFIADLEWLTRPNNFVKVLEGRYHVKDSPLSKLSEAGRKTAMAAMELIKELQEQEERDGVVH